eukprot:738060-Lingulodinium_polyedra.AAC.1
MVLSRAPKEDTVQGTIEDVVAGGNACAPLVSGQRAEVQRACEHNIASLAMTQGKRIPDYGPGFTCPSAS